jgi:hypothetical protein
MATVARPPVRLLQITTDKRPNFEHLQASQKIIFTVITHLGDLQNQKYQ